MTFHNPDHNASISNQQRQQQQQQQQQEQQRQRSQSTNSSFTTYNKELSSIINQWHSQSSCHHINNLLYPYVETDSLYLPSTPPSPPPSLPGTENSVDQLQESQQLSGTSVPTVHFPNAGTDSESSDNISEYEDEDDDEEDVDWPHSYPLQSKQMHQVENPLKWENSLSDHNDEASTLIKPSVQQYRTTVNGKEMSNSVRKYFKARLRRFISNVVRAQKQHTQQRQHIILPYQMVRQQQKLLHHHHQPQQRTSLLTLPTHVLNLVLDYLQYQSPSPKTPPTHMHSVLLTCKRLYLLTVPRLYENLSLDLSVGSNESFDNDDDDNNEQIPVYAPYTDHLFLNSQSSLSLARALFFHNSSSYHSISSNHALLSVKSLKIKLTGSNYSNFFLPSISSSLSHNNLGSENRHNLPNQQPYLDLSITVPNLSSISFYNIDYTSCEFILALLEPFKQKANDKVHPLETKTENSSSYFTSESTNIVNNLTSIHLYDITLAALAELVTSNDDDFRNGGTTNFNALIKTINSVHLKSGSTTSRNNSQIKCVNSDKTNTQNGQLRDQAVDDLKLLASLVDESTLPNLSDFGLGFDPQFDCVDNEFETQLHFFFSRLLQVHYHHQKSSFSNSQQHCFSKRQRLNAMGTTTHVWLRRKLRHLRIYDFPPYLDFAPYLEKHIARYSQILRICSHSFSSSHRTVNLASSNYNELKLHSVSAELNPPNRESLNFIAKPSSSSSSIFSNTTGCYAYENSGHNNKRKRKHYTHDDDESLLSLHQKQVRHVNNHYYDTNISHITNNCNDLRLAGSSNEEVTTTTTTSLPQDEKKDSNQALFTFTYLASSVENESKFFDLLWRHCAFSKLNLRLAYCDTPFFSNYQRADDNGNESFLLSAYLSDLTLDGPSVFTNCSYSSTFNDNNAEENKSNNKKSLNRTLPNLKKLVITKCNMESMPDLLNTVAPNLEQLFILSSSSSSSPTSKEFSCLSSKELLSLETLFSRLHMLFIQHPIWFNLEQALQQQGRSQPLRTTKSNNKVLLLPKRLVLYNVMMMSGNSVLTTNNRPLFQNGLVLQTTSLTHVLEASNEEHNNDDNYDLILAAVMDNNNNNNNQSQLVYEINNSS